MAADKTPIRIAQAVGIMGAAFAGGMINSITTFSVSAALMAPHDLMLRQWAHVYDRGHLSMPPLAAISASAFAFLAYGAPTQTLSRLYASAGALTIGIVPWTLAALVPTNNELFARLALADLRAKDPSVGDVEDYRETTELVAKWGRLNFVRSLFPIAGAALGAWTVLF